MVLRIHDSVRRSSGSIRVWRPWMARPSFIQRNWSACFFTLLHALKHIRRTFVSLRSACRRALVDLIDDPLKMKRRCWAMWAHRRGAHRVDVARGGDSFWRRQDSEKDHQGDDLPSRRGGHLSCGLRSCRRACRGERSFLARRGFAVAATRPGAKHAMGGERDVGLKQRALRRGSHWRPPAAVENRAACKRRTGSNWPIWLIGGLRRRSPSLPRGSAAGGDRARSSESGRPSGARTDFAAAAFRLRPWRLQPCRLSDFPTTASFKPLFIARPRDPSLRITI